MPTSKDDTKPTFLPGLEPGPTPPVSPDGPIGGRSGRGLVRASLSARRGEDVVLLMNGICGPTFSGLSRPRGPLSSWENRLRARLGMVGSTESALIWREKATPAGRSIFRLAPWTRPTSGKGSIGSQSETWRTPNARQKGGGSYSDPRKAELRMASGHQINLQDEMVIAANWSTPRASDGEKGGPNQSFGAGGQPLPAQMHQFQVSPWVTPSSRDWKDSPGMATNREDGRSRLDQLPRLMAVTWVTPQARDGSKGKEGPRPHDTGISLPQHVAATVLSGPTPNGSSATTERRGAPNPAFAFWLMGWPDEFTNGVLRATASISRSRSKFSPRSRKQ